MLIPLDRSLHDVAAFSSGVVACDQDLIRQSHDPRNRCLVMTEGRRILAFGRYGYAEAGPENALRPCVLIQFIARSETARPGTGLDFTLRLLLRIAKDPKAVSGKGLLIDSMNCGDLTACERRWRFFTKTVGFTPLKDDGRPFGYAFMPMATLHDIAATVGRG